MTEVLLPSQDRPPANRAERRAVNLVINRNGRKEIKHDPVNLHGVFPLPIDLCARVLVGKTVNGQPIGLISPLYPSSQFRQICYDAANRWLHDMDLRGYKPSTPVDELRVSGPYPPHDWGGVARTAAMRAVGYSADEIFDFGVVDFRLAGRFVADHRYVSDEEVEKKYRLKELVVPNHYAIGTSGRPGRTEDDEVMRLLAERDLLIQQAKKRR